RKAFKLITALDEDLLHSSGPDSADSGDDADLIQGRDPSYDVVDDDDEEEVGASPRPAPQREAEGEEGVGLQQTEAPGQRHSLVMQLAGEPKRSLTSCHIPYHIFCPKGGQ
ncbi:hypothetical protein ABVT39_001165, partial [Epinephelus coioides]